MLARITVALLVVVSLSGFRDVSADLPDFVTPEIIEMVHDDKIRCMDKFGTDQGMIDQVNTGTILNDPKLTCYMHCLFESFGVIDEDSGDFEYEMLLGFFPDDIQAQGRDILSSCAEQDGADLCDKVYKIATCIQAKAPTMWFML
ncbi:general odorant-binding protein 69a-like [Venturia canescens]|uniref:general odorant-binding protein 69a-like n=1 Tax=Venturia canescens TaxID=32260 RepID=UPI001C9D2D73|nr:general odorant-binding protein 69a-like [Venturia canescens]